MRSPAPIFWLLHRFNLRAADTQTTVRERSCLATHATGRRMLVEIGVMHGASTRLLSEVMAPEGTLVAVDPFPGGRFGVSFEWAIARREVTRAPRRRVLWRRARSEDAARTWSDAIDFLFIDGDHSWQGIAHDWTAWSRFVAVGGIVALHDSCAVDGRPVTDSVRFTNEFVLSDRRFDLIDQVDSLTVLSRRPDGA